MSEISVDISQPPFCVIRHPQKHSAEDFDKLFEQLRAVIPQGSRWAALVDLRQLSALSGGAEVREAASVSILENVDFFRDMIVGEARVATGPMMRGVLTVLDWATPRPWPVRVFGSGEVAENWLRSRLEAEGIKTPVARIWDEKLAASL